LERGGSPSSLVNTVPPFVGRTRELGWFDGWLHEVVAGHPRVVLIEGDAGIGRTRLLQEVRSMAERLRMQVCFGRCYEDLALPYLPFAESLLPLLQQVPEGARQDLEADFDVIGQLRYGTNALPPAIRPSGQADHDKLQLFLAMGRVTVKLAQIRPTVFVADDLHWADGLSLDLFDHLAFTAADTAVREPVPLLIIGTHRPVAAAERVARLRARLQREEVCRTVTLAGFNEMEIHELIGGLGLPRPSHQLTATVSEATHGNPLFVQEVLHHLLREDAVQQQGGYLVTSTASSELRLPDQVTGAIVARTRGISEACRRVLALASFLGDSFSLKVLGGVSDLGEEDLLNLLEEGMRHGLLHSEGHGFQFAHPLIRHVFYQEPSAPRRQRLHKQIAERLQRLYADHRDVHLMEIAHHLVRAGAAADADTVVDCARRAADQAFGVFAWSEAAYYYEAALAAAKFASRLSTEDRASFHYRAGLAHYYDQDVGPCLHHYDKAIDAYREIGDIRGLAQALMEKTRTHFTLATVPLGTLADLKPLEDVLGALGDREPGLRGHIAAVMSEAYRNGRQAEKARQRAQQALEIGQQLGDDYLCAYASFALGLAHINDLHVREALDGWQNALAYARRADDSIREGWALHRLPLVHTLLGTFDDAEAVAGAACEVTRKSHDWGNHSLGLSHLASVAVARGDFELAERQVHETMLMVSRSRYPWGGLRSLLALACARALRGAWAEAEDALDVLIEPGRVFEDPGPIVRAFAGVFRQLLRAYADTVDQPLGPMAAELMEIVGADTYSLAPLCALVELGDLTGAPAIAALPYEALSRAAGRGVLFSSGWMFLMPRVLGVAAAVDRQWETADAHFRAAIEVATGVGARPELGRACLDYARMLIARGGESHRHRAIELVRQAGPIFLDLGMQPFVRRAAQLAEALDTSLPTASPQPVAHPDDLSEREIEVLVRMAGGRTGQEIAGDLVLGQKTIAGHMTNIFNKTRVGDQATATAYAVEKGLAPRADAAPLLRIILVSDVVASGALILRSGDAKAHGLIQIHDALIRQCLRAHEGIEIAHTGDGIEAAFDASSRAVECAVAIQTAFARHNREHPTDTMQVRIGVHAGEPIASEGRLFGAAVHATFRICARAQPDQILVSDAVSQLVAGKGFTLTNRGQTTLKGLGRMRLHEVVWEAEPA
jgi:class 3 adenylate cyclase/tetratricopeptide (TPR) repeat protein